MIFSHFLIRHVKRIEEKKYKIKKVDTVQVLNMQHDVV
jgi:hypothetical protein